MWQGYISYSFHIFDPFLSQFGDIIIKLIISVDSESQEVFMKQLDADCIVNIIGGLLLIGLVVCIHLLKPMFFSDLWHVLLNGDMHEMIAYINSFGAWFRNW